jgi:DNA-binding transcriptional LysR family regulator
MRYIDLSDLHVFRTVVAAGGVTRASERLHRVQSNVTTRIKKLEEDLGVRLFLREGKRMQLTAAGRLLMDYADQLLGLAERARDALHETTPRGVLRLGSMESTAAVRLPAPLTEYHDLYPDVTVELHAGAPRELTAMVFAGELDAALVAEPVDDPRLERRTVFKEEMVIIADARHPPIASPADLRRRTMLVFHPGCPHRKRLEDWFAEDGVVIERVVEMNSFHALLGCTVAGMGIALMLRCVLDGYAELSRLSVHELRPGFRWADTLLIWRKGAPQAKVSALAEILLGPG